MTIIIICDFAMPSGGSQAVAIASARALAEAGVPVTFIHAVAGHDARLVHPLIQIVCVGFPDVWDRPLIQGAIAGVWNRATTRALRDVLSTTASAERSIVHIHQWTRAFSPSVFGAAFASGAPVVVTAHDYFLVCPNGVYYRFDRGRPCDRKPLSVGCLTAGCDPKSPAHKAIRVARAAATSAVLAGHDLDVVHVSDRGRDTLKSLLPAHLRHHRIDNPVVLSRPPAADIQADAGFAFLGRMTREKGAVVAAEAARVANVPIRFIGDGPAEDEIRAVNPNAEIMGWRSRAEIAALFQGQVRAVVAPSLWYETGPLTVYEAAAAGIGAIASNRCGASERVAPNSTGLVVEPSVEGVAKAMRQFADLATARRFGAAAYDRYWADPPSPESHATTLIALYDDILARPVRGSFVGEAGPR